MCGIAGIVNLRDGLMPPDIDDLRQMVGTLRHRGPDEFGVYRDARAGLGHARLSIIDLLTGQQPLANETNTLWISFNGEIFNYLELREELEGCGHRFRTRSDTEVIVHAYEQWGASAFRRFNGQWAVALWDGERKTLVLARDPFGVRPLYICEHGGRMYFASEVKAIFAADASIPREFDPGECRSGRVGRVGPSPYPPDPPQLQPCPYACPHKRQKPSGDEHTEPCMRTPRSSIRRASPPTPRARRI